jgi:hypothetical protein
MLRRHRWYSSGGPSNQREIHVFRPGAFKTFVPILFIAMMAGVAHGQVSARQGTPEAGDEQVRFKSPMILDLPLTLADKKLWGKAQVRSTREVALRKYSCDGVSFVDFAGSAARQRDGRVKLTFSFTLRTEPGNDKLASVKIGVMAGEREIAARIRENVDAEEGKIAMGQVSMLVPEAELLADPAPTLRIIVRVMDNS